jgi:hypothetical protein
MWLANNLINEFVSDLQDKQEYFLCINLFTCLLDDVDTLGYLLEEIVLLPDEVCFIIKDHSIQIQHSCSDIAARLVQKQYYSKNHLAAISEQGLGQYCCKVILGTILLQTLFQYCTLEPCSDIAAEHHSCSNIGTTSEQVKRPCSKVHPCSNIAARSIVSWKITFPFDLTIPDLSTERSLISTLMGILRSNPGL